MDLKMDDGLKALLESGKEKGYLTYSQVNEYLPDDAVNPEKLDQLLMLLEEQGIELIDESEAEEREAGPAAPPPSRRGRRGELDLGLHRRRGRPAHRRSRSACTSRRWARSRCSSARRKSRSPRRSKSPASASAARCSNAITPCATSSRRSSASTPASCRSTAPSRCRSPRTSRRTRSSSGCRTTCKTLEHLMEQNVEDFTRSLDERARRGRTQRRSAAALKIRRRKAVTLVEELSIRTQKVQPLMKKLEQISRADGRAGTADRRPAGQPHRQGRPGQPRKGAARPDAA